MVRIVVVVEEIEGIVYTSARKVDGSSFSLQARVFSIRLPCVWPAPAQSRDSRPQCWEEKSDWQKSRKFFFCVSELIMHTSWFTSLSTV